MPQLKAAHTYSRLDPETHAMLKAAAIDAARTRLASPALTGLTDNSTGVAIGSGVIPSTTLPSKFSGAGATKAPKAGFDTATTKAYDAVITLAAWLNGVRAKLGLTALTYTGTPSVAGTLAALDKALVAVDGTGSNAVDYATGRAEIGKLRNNLSTVIFAANQVLAAVGKAKIADQTQGSIAIDYALTARAATAAGVTGADADTASLSDADVDAFLTAFAHAVATVAAKLNDAADLDPLPALELVYIG